MKESFCRASGVPIRYFDVGGGPPVVLIHGFSATAEMWSPVVDRLSPRFRVVALDCRGHGRSGKPHTAGAYGSEMVDDVVRMMDEIGIERAHLVGYSMGAEIALGVTTRYPKRVRSLVMGGSGWSGAAEQELYRALGDSLEESGSFAPLVVAMVPEGEPKPTEEELSALDALLEGQDLAALAAVARGMHGILDLPEEALAAVPIPVLGIAGKYDPERANLEKMNGVVPDFTLSVLSGRDHMSAVEDPGFPAAIAGFLETRR